MESSSKQEVSILNLYQDCQVLIMIIEGTTAQPKVSFYSHDELEVVSRDLAESLIRCGVRQGDAVINLFYAGDMYGSFLLHILSVFYLSVCKKIGAVQIPVAGHVPIKSMVTHILEFEGTVVLSTATCMVKMAELLLEEEGVDGAHSAPSVRLMLFSGEALYKDQIGLISRAFPNSEIRSLVYGSMDSGVIGLPPSPEVKYQFPVADGVTDPRVHQVNRPDMIVEIITEDGESTREPGVKGRLVVTNLARMLMPVVRYPSGDTGEWLDYDSGLFRVLGRDQTALRLGPVSIDFAHLRQAVSAALGPEKSASGLQAIVSRRSARDTLTVLVAYPPKDQDESMDLARRIAGNLEDARPMFKEHVALGIINPLEVSFVRLESLTSSERSGKAIDVIDRRDVTL